MSFKGLRFLVQSSVNFPLAIQFKKCCSKKKYSFPSITLSSLPNAKKAIKVGSLKSASTFTSAGKKAKLESWSSILKVDEQYTRGAVAVGGDEVK